MNGIPEGSLEVKLPTIWTDGKAEVRRVREEKSREEKESEEEVAKHYVFSNGLWSKSRLAKAAVRSHVAR